MEKINLEKCELEVLTNEELISTSGGLYQYAGLIMFGVYLFDNREDFIAGFKDAASAFR